MISVKTELVKNIYVSISEQEKKENIIIGFKNVKKILEKDKAKNLKLHINSNFILDEELKLQINELEEQTKINKVRYENIEIEEEISIPVKEEEVLPLTGINNIYKKAIRSGHIVNFVDIKIMTENINSGGSLEINNGFVILLKNNNGKILINSGTLLICKEAIIGNIEVEDINIYENINEVVKITNEFNFIYINVSNKELTIETI